MIKPKPVKERNNIELLELTLQLHSRALRAGTEEMHNAYVEARNELEQRLEASPLETLVSGTDFERLKEILIETPELNMANYDHEDVRKLNDALIEIYEIIYSE